MPNYPPPPVSPTVSAKRNVDGTVLLRLALHGSGDDQSPSLRFVRSIKDILFIVHIPGTTVFDTLHPILSSSGQMSETLNTASLTIHGESLWRNPLQQDFDTLEVRVLIETFSPQKYESQHHFHLPSPATSSSSSSPPLKVTGTVEFNSDSTITFVLLAERIAPAQNEYFPTSERLRVIVYNSSGTMIWNSAEGVMFLQVIGPVEPQHPGEVHRYELQWALRDRKGNTVSPGRYIAHLILPIIPAPIKTTVEFSIGEQR